MSDRRDQVVDSLKVRQWIKNYAASPTDTVVDTGIVFENNANADLNFQYGAVYELSVKNNPNVGGSGKYQTPSLGYITIGTGWNGSATTTYINYTSVAQPDIPGVTEPAISAVFWDGATETTNMPSDTANRQIRVKIPGNTQSLTVRLRKII